MTRPFAVFVEGLSSLQDVNLLQDDIRFAASRAVNKITRDSRTSAARRIGREVNFPNNYLNPAAKRLFVSHHATPNKLEGRITARSRPTSLARFVRGQPRKGQGVHVEVKPGKARFMRRAFLIRLPAGSGPIDTKFNMVLAMRLRPGESLANKKQARRIEKGLYLLYGPSIDQVFLSKAGRGVADDMEPEVLDNLEEEFYRLLDL